VGGGGGVLVLRGGMGGRLSPVQGPLAERGEDDQQAGKNSTSEGKRARGERTVRCKKRVWGGKYPLFEMRIRNPWGKVIT